MSQQIANQQAKEARRDTGEARRLKGTSKKRKANTEPILLAFQEYRENLSFILKD